MADENKKGITVKIDADLHAQVKAYIESRGMTMAEFITAACDDLLHPKITEKEDKKIPAPIFSKKPKHRMGIRSMWMPAGMWRLRKSRSLAALPM